MTSLGAGFVKVDRCCIAPLPTCAYSDSDTEREYGDHCLSDGETMQSYVNSNRTDEALYCDADPRSDGGPAVEDYLRITRTLSTRLRWRWTRCTLPRGRAHRLKRIVSVDAQRRAKL